MTTPSRPTLPAPGAAGAAARRIGLLLLALTLLVPALWVAQGWHLRAQTADDEARVIAWGLAVPAAQADWAPRLAPLVQAVQSPGETVMVEWLDAGGRPLATLGQRPPAPHHVAQQPVHGRGLVRVTQGMQPLLLQGAALALVCAALALALWWAMLRNPVHTLARAERHFEFHARTDTLTGLLNREGLLAHLRGALGQARRQSDAVGVLAIDLDRFAIVNSGLGQAAGDRLLHAVGQRLAGIVLAHDGLARLGGDQFAIVTRLTARSGGLDLLARNVMRALELPFVVDGRELQVTCSVGSSLSAPGQLDEDTLLRAALAALRSAKLAGGACHRGAPAAGDGDGGEGRSLAGGEAVQRLDLELQLRRALRSTQFSLLYQPIVCAQTRRTRAVEALIRWSTPDRGVVGPASFIPVLEETGLIVPVGHWVLQQACRQAASWRRQGEDALVLSVNISPRQFAEPDFVPQLQHTLASTGWPGTQLQLEVTEGLLLDPSPATLQRLDELNALGVRLAIDDFGVGYSSLAYLKRFRLHTLKIDKLFVQDLGRSPSALAIARAIVELGHGMGLSVTAEGVETEEQALALRGIGCDTMQGYLFQPPVPAASVLGLAAAAPVPAAPAPQPATA